MELPVVTGVDGSAHSLAALDWAVDEAARRGAVLRLVHADGRPADGTTGPDAPARPPAAPPPAERLLAEAADRARRRNPAVGVVTESVPGDPVLVLVEAGRDAAMLVTGSRGRGAVAGLLLGSVSPAVAVRSGRPVVVVRPRADGRSAASETGAPVVLGAGDAGEGSAAARFALREAAARSTALLAVRAWHRPHEQIRHPLLTGSPSAAEEEQAEWLLGETLRAPRREYPRVEVGHRVDEGPAHQVLLDASRSAALLVVGAHGRADHGAGLRLGKVTHAVLRHAECPVAVVPVRS
ncbi:universal stress protein [Streptomyces zingiberis]|uniref:Universal stress protein n=1 Tax=Streptomyces zingiberis TaxID=2053010 RepID=A0ABX1BY17_9ACTN|nr:universal stress protein [Streptomyces zingiberis]NJQ00204.1 universal stress protein [Streptomyces zingiberis]